MKLTLKNINHDERSVLFETDNGESFKTSFEYIEDINRYISKEWDFVKLPKKYRIGFKYKNGPWILFEPVCGDISKFGCGEEIIIQSDSVDVIKQSLERVRYHACGMSMIDIIQMY